VEDHSGTRDLCTDPAEETVREWPVNVKDIEPVMVEKPERGEETGEDVTNTGEFETKAGNLIGRPFIVCQILPPLREVPETTNRDTEEFLIP